MPIKKKEALAVKAVLPFGLSDPADSMVLKVSGKKGMLTRVSGKSQRIQQTSGVLEQGRELYTL